jgi:hypothetical protein
VVLRILFCSICLSALFVSVLAAPALPDKVPGSWSAAGKQAEYPGRALYDYIDGGADIYFDFGFSNCSARTYYPGKDTTDQVVVNVYDQEKRINAFGLFRELLDPDASPAAAGAEGLLQSRMLTFWKHRYYVEIIDKSMNGLDNKVLLDLARGIAKGLEGPNSLPPGLKQLPARNRVKGSEQYYRINFMSRKYLSNALCADYKVGKEEIRFFVINFGSVKKAKAAFDKWTGDFEKAKPANKKFKGRPAVYTNDITVVLDKDRILGAKGESTFSQRRKLILSD